jgi:hypothetical protein
VRRFIGVANGLYNAFKMLYVEWQKVKQMATFATQYQIAYLNIQLQRFQAYTFATSADVAAGSQSKHSFHAKNICSFNGVAHDPANPNFYIDVTADFNLSITGTL